METVLAAAITGMLTLIGALIFNSRNRAVVEVKLDLLSERVCEHNEVVSRTYQLDLIELTIAPYKGDRTGWRPQTTSCT